MPLIKKPIQKTEVLRSVADTSLPSWAGMTLVTHPYMYDTDEKTGMPWFLVRDISRHPTQEAEVSEPE